MKRLIVILGLLAVSAGREAQCLEVTKKLLVINNLAESLTAVNLSDGAITTTESNVYGLAPNVITVHNGKGYVVNSRSHNISVIDLNDYSVERTIPLPDGSNPWDMEFVDVSTAYVTSYAYNKIYILDMTQDIISDSVGVGIAPGEMLRVGGVVYVLNTGFNLTDYSYARGSVTVIDIRSREEVITLPMPLNPQSVTTAPDGRIYILSTGDYFANFGKLTGIDIWTDVPGGMDSIAVGGSPSDIKFTPAGMGFIAAGGEWQSGTKGYVYLYKLHVGLIRGPENPVIVGNGAGRIMIDNATDEVFVSCFQDDNVQKLDPVTGEVLATYPAGDGAQAMALQYSITSDVTGAAGVHLEINSGSVGDSISITAFGMTIPSELSAHQNFGNAVEYFEIAAEADNFAALLTVSYSDSLLEELDIAENDLILSYFSETDMRWHSIPTVIDAAANTASAEVTHFSFWALADKHDDVISGVRTEPAVPQSFALFQNYPNPFNPVTTIAFSLPKKEMIRLTVYNILGQPVRRLLAGTMPAGEHRITWDGRTDAQQTVAAGVYFYRIEAGNFSAVKKMLYLR